MRRFTITAAKLRKVGACDAEVRKLVRAGDLPLTLTDDPECNALVLARKFPSLDWAWTRIIASYIASAVFGGDDHVPDDLYVWSQRGGQRGREWATVFDEHGSRQNLGLLAAYAADVVGNAP